MRTANKRSLFIILFFLFLLFIFSTKVEATTYSIEYLSAKYPNGSVWNGTYEGEIYENGVPIGIDATECAGFSALMYKSYYGIDPYACAERSYTANDIQPGDIVRYNYDTHSVWVIARNGNSVTIADCNADTHNGVRWYYNTTLGAISSGLTEIMKAPYVIGQAAPALNPPTNIKASLTNTGISVSWNKAQMASGYYIVVYNADSVDKGDFSNKLATRTIDTPSITNANLVFKETGRFYVYVHTLRGDLTSTTGGTPAVISNSPITAVEVTTAESGCMTVGESRLYTANITPSNTTTSKSITWTISDTSIATVNSNGVVTAKKEGNTWLTAKTANNLTHRILVKVSYTKTPIIMVDIDSYNKTIKVGQTLQLNYSYYPKDATGDTTLRFSSLNPSIAKVDSLGKVTAIAPGKATIKAESVNGKTDTLEITVENGVSVTGIKMNSSYSLTEGNSGYLTATVEPSNATNKTITWSIDNSSVATVDQNGKITALKAGNTVVRAKAGNYTATCNLNVVSKNIPVTNLKLNKTSLNLFEGDSETIIATIEPSNATNKVVSWSSNNSNIAIVNNGKITAKSIGTATITAKVGNISKTCTVKVNKKEIHITDITPVIIASGVGKDKKFQIVTKVSPENTTDDKTIAYNSSNNSIATIDQNGFITVKSAGTVNFTVRTKNGSIMTFVPYTFTSDDFYEEKEKVTLKFRDQSMNVTEGNRALIFYTLTPVDAKNVKITWKSSNENIAKANSDGTVTGLKAGKVIITAEVDGGNKATINVNVIAKSGTTSKDNNNVKTPDTTKKVEKENSSNTSKANTNTNNSNVNNKENNTNKKVTANVLYQTHVQNIGWQGFVKDGAMSGTSGKSLRLEGIKIKLDTNNITGGIEYRTHVQNIGWQKYVKNGAMSGTSGKSLRLEAIQIKLTGDISKKYDVYYRVHSQNFGWMGWAKNGESAGTAGFGYRLEGIEIKLVEKNKKAPGSTLNKFRQNVLYQTHVQNIGWQNYVGAGETSGTSGQSLRLEGIKIRIDSEISGNVEYRTHVQNIGWQNYVKNGAMSGTSGKGLRLEAINIRLTGELAKKYDIYYRVHSQNFGWMGWAKNGESAGTAGFGYRLEGIQIVLVDKGSSAPGTTKNSFIQK